MTKNFKSHPSNEYPHFLNDPEGDGLLFFPTAAERDEAAKELIGMYLEDNEWLDGTPDICTGTLVHIVRPTNENPDEEGYDYGLVKVEC